MRVDLLFHIIGAEAATKLLKALGLSLEQIEILLNTGGFIKELTDVTGFDWLDIIANNVGILMGWF